MSDFYDEMRDEVASPLLKEFAQAAVSLKRVTTADPDPSTPWEPGEETTETWPLDAVVKRVDQRYENGVLIVATVDIVTFAVPATVPLITDVLVIDGKDRAITGLKPTPSAGTVVKWTAICAV
jgi:hypothetical protein